MNNDIIKNAKRTAYKVGFKLRKHSPEILTTAGVIGVVIGTVLACKATTKAGDILADAAHDLDEVHRCAQDAELEEDYTTADAKKDTASIYIRTGARLAALYAPAVTVEALSLTAMISAHCVLRKRNLDLAAAYAALSTGFKQYRSRVAERFGDDVEREIRHNLRAMVVTEEQEDDNGEKTAINKTIKVANSAVDGYSDYARFFDEASPYWEKDSEYNLMFLRAQQNFANDKLKAQGYLFLNDVYDMLGIPRTKAGQIVGWRYNPDHGVGDNYIDFGI